MLFSRGSSQPRDQTQVCIAGRFFTIWTTREVPCSNEERDHITNHAGSKKMIRGCNEHIYANMFKILNWMGRFLEKHKLLTPTWGKNRKINLLVACWLQWSFSYGGRNDSSFLESTDPLNMSFFSLPKVLHQHYNYDDLLNSHVNDQLNNKTMGLGDCHLRCSMCRQMILCPQGVEEKLVSLTIISRIS